MHNEQYNQETHLLKNGKKKIYKLTKKSFPRQTLQWNNYNGYGLWYFKI